MNEFLDALHQIRNSTSRDFFSNLYNFFLRISTFNREEVIAAAHTYEIFRYNVLTKEECQQYESELNQIKNALSTRMCLICCDAPESQRGIISKTLSHVAYDTGLNWIRLEDLFSQS